MNRDQLKSLRAFEDQKFTLGVRNGSNNPFSKVSLTLRVSSEDTTLASARYYRAEVSDLKAGESGPVPFTLDLSPLAERTENKSFLSGDQVQSRTVLEVQATTPEGISTVKTAVLPLSGDAPP